MKKKKFYSIITHKGLKIDAYTLGVVWSNEEKGFKRWLIYGQNSLFLLDTWTDGSAWVGRTIMSVYSISEVDELYEYYKNKGYHPEEIHEGLISKY